MADIKQPPQDLGLGEFFIRTLFGVVITQMSRVLYGDAMLLFLRGYQYGGCKILITSWVRNHGDLRLGTSQFVTQNKNTGLLNFRKPIFE